MNLLALETSTEACSVALLSNRDGRQQLLQRHEIAPRRHAELVLPWIDVLLAEAGLAKSQIDAIAVGRGPGAFTGVRLAIALAQGLALALDRPVLPVSSLAALALQAADSIRADVTQADATQKGVIVLAAIDARMGEVYSGAFAGDGDGLVLAVGQESIAAPATMPLPTCARCLGVGTGFAAGDGVLQTRLGAGLVHCDASALPRAANVARLAARDFAAGLAIAPDLLEPAYLRDKVALTIVEQQALKS